MSAAEQFIWALAWRFPLILAQYDDEQRLCRREKMESYRDEWQNGWEP